MTRIVAVVVVTLSAIASLIPTVTCVCVNPIYQRFHLNHTACKDPLATCATTRVSGHTDQSATIKFIVTFSTATINKRMV